jgi:type I restriction enzyme S subunit
MGLISPMYTVFEIDERQADPDFILRLFKFYATNGQFDALGNGGVNRRKSISFSTLGKLSIPLPPLHEQRRIGEILSSVDEAIAATRAVIEQTRRVKQSVLERLLTKGIGHTRFKQTEIGEVPEGWELTSADDVCTQVSVGIVIKPSQYYVENGVRCFRSANVREGFVEDADWVYINEQGNRVNQKSVLRTGDVLVVRTGYPGTSCVVPPRYDGANCIDIIFARPKIELIDPYFLSTFINSASGKTQVLKAEGGLAQKHFNVGSMKQMKLPLPPLNEQQEIVGHIQDFASTEAALERTLQQQIRCKSAVISDLVTGRKRVTAALPMAAE